MNHISGLSLVPVASSVSLSLSKHSIPIQSSSSSWSVVGLQQTDIPECSLHGLVLCASFKSKPGPWGSRPEHNIETQWLIRGGHQSVVGSGPQHHFWCCCWCFCGSSLLLRTVLVSSDRQLHGYILYTVATRRNDKVCACAAMQDICWNGAQLENDDSQKTFTDK